MILPKDPVKFSLVVQIWRGPKVIREGPSRIIWRFLLDMPDGDNPATAFSLSSNPIENNEVTAYKTPCPDKDALKRGKPNEDRDYLKPEERSFWNDTKDTPSSVKQLDSGTVVFYIIDGFWKFLAKGRHLKGIYTLSRQGKTKMWTWKKSAGPGEKNKE